MKNVLNLLFYFLLFQIIISCAPKLYIYEIENKIKEDNIAMSRGDVEYIFDNMPKKYVKEYGKVGLREKLMKIYKNKNYPLFAYMNIDKLDVHSVDKCNSYYYYKVIYRVTKMQFTPYLDSTALLLNKKIYGPNNVKFDSISNNLYVTRKENKVLIFDKDKKWKIFSIKNASYLDKYYGVGFFDCINSY